MKWSKKVYYKGDWANHEMHGEGTFTDEAYCKLPLEGELGEWENGKFTGVGKISWHGGNEEYTGGFANDKFDGRGMYKWADGRSYDGGTLTAYDQTTSGRALATALTEPPISRNERLTTSGIFFFVNIQPTNPDRLPDCSHNPHCHGRTPPFTAWAQDQMNGEGVYTWMQDGKRATYTGTLVKDRFDGPGSCVWEDSTTHQTSSYRCGRRCGSLGDFSFPLYFGTHVAF